MSKKCIKSLKIIGNNSAGIKAKTDSFQNVLNQLKPGVVLVQESKLYKKGTLKFSDYCVFEKVRKENEGGGLMTLVHSNLKPIMIPIENDSKMAENVLVIEAQLGKSKVRFINAYGPQETSPLDDRTEFFGILDQQIQECLNKNIMLCLELDANAKVGNVAIPYNPQENISPNGQLLLELIERNQLILVNASSKCHGKLTRVKTKKGITEKSILDYFIVCQSFYNLINEMVVDEEKKFVLKKYSKVRGEVKVTESDHNIMWLDINIPWVTQICKERFEIFNLRNKECQEKFFQFTNNSKNLSKSALIEDVKIAGKTWLKNLKFSILQSFRKIRISSEKNRKSEIEVIMESQTLMQPGSKEYLKCEKMIAEKVIERNRKIILDQLQNISDPTCNLSRVKMWRIRQSVCPKNVNPVPVPKMNENGDLI